MTITGPDYFNFGLQNKAYHDFDIVPDAKQIKVIFGAATVSNNEDLIIRLITSAGVLTTGPSFGYHSRAMLHMTAGNNLAYPPGVTPGFNDGFRVIVGHSGLGLHGHVDLDMLDDDIHAWTAKWVISFAGSPTMQSGAGSKQCDTEVIGLRVMASGSGVIGNGRIAVQCSV